MDDLARPYSLEKSALEVVVDFGWILELVAGGTSSFECKLVGLADWDLGF